MRNKGYISLYLLGNGEGQEETRGGGIKHSREDGELSRDIALKGSRRTRAKKLGAEDRG